MGMKLPIAATSIACSACIAASVAVPTIALPEKSVQDDAARSVTQDYTLLSFTDPATGAATLVAVPLEDLGAINKFFTDKLLTPLFTVVSSPLNIPTQISNISTSGLTPQQIFDNNVTKPIQTLAAFPANLADFLQSLGAASTLTARGSNVALAAADTGTGTGLGTLGSPLEDLGAVNKFFTDNLLNPLFTVVSSPLNIPTQISNISTTGLTPQQIFDNNVTKPLQKLAAFPTSLAAFLQSLGGASTMTVRQSNVELAAADASPLEDLGAINKFFTDKLFNPAFTVVSSPLNIPTQISNIPATGSTVEAIFDKNVTTPIETLAAFPANLATFAQSLFGPDALSRDGANIALAAADIGTGTDTNPLASPLEDLGAINKFFADKLLSPAFTLLSSPLNIPTQISNIPATPEDDTPQTIFDKNVTTPIKTLAAFPANLAAFLKSLDDESAPAAADANQLTADPTPKLEKPAANDEKSGTPDTTVDPTVGAKSSISDVPGSVADGSTPHRSRLVDVDTDTGPGGRHRLENIGKSISGWTPSTRKTNGKKDGAGDTAGASSGSQGASSGSQGASSGSQGASHSGQPSHRTPHKHEK